MNTSAKCSRPGQGVSFCRQPQASNMHNELLELYVIFQAKLLHARDTAGWCDVFEKSVQKLLSIKPLQHLTKRGRLSVVMFIVGSRRTDLFAPTVLAVLACDWATDQWEPFKLLQGAVRQAALSGLRSTSGSMEAPFRHWSRRTIAVKLEDGVASTVADSWRGLGIQGAARGQVEKTGRELRGLAARCRGASDRAKARALLNRYLESNRLESFVKELVIWGHKQLKASKHTIFDQAFPFLEVKQDDFEPLGALEGASGTHRTERRAASSPAIADNGQDSDTSDREANFGEIKPERKRRQLGVLRTDEKVFVKMGSSRGSKLWRLGAVDTVRGDGTYNIRYDNGEVDRVVRRADMFVAGGGSRVPPGLVKAEEESCGGFDVARNKSSVLPSRQTNTRKLSRYRASSGASRIASPLDAKPVQEERTPARSAALFQAKAWRSTSGADVDADTPSARLGETKGGDDATDRRWVERRRNQKRKIIELDESSSEDFAQPLPPPLPTTSALPAESNHFSTAMCDSGSLSQADEARLPAEINDFSTAACFIEPPNRANEIRPPAKLNDVSTATYNTETPNRADRVSNGHGYHKGALKTPGGVSRGRVFHGGAPKNPDTPKRGRVEEARGLAGLRSGVGFGRDVCTDTNANSVYGRGIEGVEGDSAVLLEAGRSPRLDDVISSIATFARREEGMGQARGEEEEREEEEREEKGDEEDEDEVATDEELMKGARRRGGWEEETEKEEGGKELRRRKRGRGDRMENAGEEEEEKEERDTDKRGGWEEAGEKEEEVAADEELTGGKRGKRRLKDNKEEEEEEGEEEEDEEEEDDDTDKEFVVLHKCQGEDEPADSIRPTKDGSKEDGNGQGRLPGTGEGDVIPPRRIDTSHFLRQYDDSPSPSPASESLMSRLRLSPPLGGCTRSPLAGDGNALASEQQDNFYSEGGQDRCYSEDGQDCFCGEHDQQNERQAKKQVVDYSHQETDTDRHGASPALAGEIRRDHEREDGSASPPLADAMRGGHHVRVGDSGHPHKHDASPPVAEKVKRDHDHARVEDSSGHSDQRAGAGRSDDKHPIETSTHNWQKRNGGSGSTPIADSGNADEADNAGSSICQEQDETTSCTEEWGKKHADDNSTCPEQDEVTSADEGQDETIRFDEDRGQKHPDGMSIRLKQDDPASGEDEGHKYPDEKLIRREQDEMASDEEAGHKCPDEFDNVDDTQSPRRPSRFMRVYGSAGIARVSRSVGGWLSQRFPSS